jgi:hypothetical protein
MLRGAQVGVHVDGRASFTSPTLAPDDRAFPAHWRHFSQFRSLFAPLALRCFNHLDAKPCTAPSYRDGTHAAVCRPAWLTPMLLREDKSASMERRLTSNIVCLGSAMSWHFAMLRIRRLRRRRRQPLPVPVARMSRASPCPDMRTHSCVRIPAHDHAVGVAGVCIAGVRGAGAHNTSEHRVSRARHPQRICRALMQTASDHSSARLPRLSALRPARWPD